MKTRKPVRAAAMLAIAFAFKLQTIFFFPIVLLGLIHGEYKPKHALVFALAYLATTVPALIAGRSLGDALGVYVNQSVGQYYDRLTYNAPNLYTFFPMLVFANTQEYTWMRYIAGVDGKSPNAYLRDDLMRMMQDATLYACVALVLIVVIYWLMHAKEVTPEMTLDMALFFAIFLPFVMPKIHERYFFMADMLSILYASRRGDRRFCASAGDRRVADELYADSDPAEAGGRAHSRIDDAGGADCRFARSAERHASKSQNPGKRRRDGVKKHESCRPPCARPGLLLAAVLAALTAALNVSRGPLSNLNDIGGWTNRMAFIALAAAAHAAVLAMQALLNRKGFGRLALRQVLTTLGFLLLTLPINQKTLLFTEQVLPLVRKMDAMGLAAANESALNLSAPALTLLYAVTRGPIYDMYSIKLLCVVCNLGLAILAAHAADRRNWGVRAEVLLTLCLILPQGFLAVGCAGQMDIVSAFLLCAALTLLDGEGHPLAAMLVYGAAPR